MVNELFDHGYGSAPRSIRPDDEIDFLKVFGKFIDGVQLGGGSAICNCADSDGYLYVFNQSGGNLSKYDMEGNLIASATHSATSNRLVGITIFGRYLFYYYGTSKNVYLIDKDTLASSYTLISNKSSMNGLINHFDGKTVVFNVNSVLYCSEIDQDTGTITPKWSLSQNITPICTSFEGYVYGYDATHIRKIDLATGSIMKSDTLS